MRVSVVLATYNSRRFLEQQVASILEQSRPVDEIVVCDDGSTDGTVDLVGSLLAGFDGDIVLLAGRVGGVVANVERGLTAATGDVIVLSDHDDVWHPDKVAALSRWFEETPGAALWFSDAELIDGAGRPLPGRLWERHLFTAALRSRWEAGDPWTVLVKHSVVTGATAAVSRRVVERALPLPEGSWHDEWLALVATVTGPTRADSTPHIDYRLHGENTVGVPPRGLRDRAPGWRDGRGPDDIELLRWSLFLDRFGADLPGEARVIIEGKRDFQRWRLDLPAARWRRLPRVLRAAPDGGYPAYADSWKTLLSDLLKRWEAPGAGPL